MTGNCSFHKIAVREPSGVAYHPQRRSILVVSDEGFIAELDLDFDVRSRFEMPGDVEGLAVHPETGTVFVTVEGECAIVEYDLETRQLLRRIALDTGSHPDFASTGIGRNRGPEGVAIRAAGGTGGGWELVAVIEDHPARLITLSTDVSVEATERARRAADKPTAETARIVSTRDLGMRRLSGLTYAPESDLLIAISSKARTACCIDRQGRVSRKTRIPGRQPEGICFLPDGRAIIVQDTGGLCVWDGLSHWIRSDPFGDDP